MAIKKLYLKYSNHRAQSHRSRVLFRFLKERGSENVSVSTFRKQKLKEKYIAVRAFA